MHYYYKVLLIAEEFLRHMRLEGNDKPLYFQYQRYLMIYLQSKQFKQTDLSHLQDNTSTHWSI